MSEETHVNVPPLTPKPPSSNLKMFQQARNFTINGGTFNIFTLPHGADIQNEQIRLEREPFPNVVADDVADYEKRSTLILEMIRPLVSNDSEAQKAVALLLFIPRPSAMVESNSVDFIVRLMLRLSCRNDDKAAAAKLMNIALDEGTRRDFLKEKVIPALIRQIDIEFEADTLKFACGALRNICMSDDDARSLAFKLDAVPPLIRLFAHDSPKVKAMAASALSKICAYVPAAIAMQERRRSVPNVVKLLTSNIAEVQESAAMLLSTLCFASELARVDALKSNSIDSLVRLIQSRQRSLQAASAKALMNIALHKGPYRKYFKNAIPALIGLVDIEFEADALEFSCGALRNICRSDDGARSLAFKLDAVPPLIRLLAHDSPKVKAMAASALSKICAYVPAAIAMQERRSVPNVVKLLASNIAEVQESAAVLLSTLCFASELARVDALKSNSIDSLVRLIQSRQKDLQAASAKALMNIALHKGPYRDFFKNAIPALIGLVNIEFEADALEFSCGALRNICRSDDGARSLAFKLGAVQPLIRLLTHDSPKVKAMAVSALSLLE